MPAESSSLRHWLAIASASHVCLGREGGFMQVNHGKRPPLKRIQPGDQVVFYSPATEIRGTDRLQSFTAIGVVRPGEPYQVPISDDFQPWRRDVDWLPAIVTPIAPLLDLLSCTTGRKNWGYQFRFGVIEITGDDWAYIARAMGVPGDAWASGANE